MLLITFATAVRGVLGTTGAAFFLIVTAFLAGVGIGIAGPLLSGFIKQYFPHKPGFVSIYSASLVIGAGVATGLAVPFYEAAGNSWQISLAVWAVFGIAAVLLWIKLAKKRQTEIINRSAALPLRNKRALLITLFFWFNGNGVLYNDGMGCTDCNEYGVFGCNGRNDDYHFPSHSNSSLANLT